MASKVDRGVSPIKSEMKTSLFVRRTLVGTGSTRAENSAAWQLGVTPSVWHVRGVSVKRGVCDTRARNVRDFVSPPPPPKKKKKKKKKPLNL